MRTIIYVPIIHTSADLGSLAKDVNKTAVADLGEEFWKRHAKTVEGFWEAIAKYFDSLATDGFKIYQDGMVADGLIGRKIVEDVLKTGSKNHEVVWQLLQKGAILVKTEDFNLVKEERDRLSKMTKAKTFIAKLLNYICYKLTKNILLGKRDKYIAQRINETLDQGETGIVFLGAYHDIKKRLPRDMRINEVKDVLKLREYQRLLPFYNKHKRRFEELSNYLIST